MTKKHGKGPRGLIILLLVLAISAAAAGALCLPVLRIYGSAMAPTLSEGQILLAVKTDRPEPGDIIAFYCGSKVQVKRVVAGPGERVELEQDGRVVVNGTALEEPYLTRPHLGDGDVVFPCQVPEGMFFVLGDNRAGAVDSRHSAVGCVAPEQIIGKVIFRIWPLARVGRM